MLYVSLTYLLFLLRFALAGRLGAQKQLYPIILLSLFLFSAFRYQVGCDWSGYNYQYDNFEDNWETLKFFSEPIWWTIVAGVAKSDLPYPFLNVVSSAVFFAGVHVLARRQPDPLGFLVLLFPILIINMPMSAIRQGAAIGVLCIAFTAFIDRRPFKYAILVVLATGIHPSALIFILLLPLTRGRYTLRSLIFTAILAIPGAFLLALSAAAEKALGRYIDAEMDAAGAVFRVGFLCLSGLYYYMFMRRKWMSTFLNDYALVSICAIGFMLTLLLVPISTVLADRVGYYLIPIQAMIFARIPFLKFRWNAASHFVAPYLALLLIFTVWSQLSGLFETCYNPYQTWIFGLPASNLVGF